NCFQQYLGRIIHSVTCAWYSWPAACCGTHAAVAAATARANLNVRMEAIGRSVWNADESGLDVPRRRLGLRATGASRGSDGKILSQSPRIHKVDRSGGNPADFRPVGPDRLGRPAEGSARHPFCTRVST